MTDMQDSQQPASSQVPPTDQTGQVPPSYYPPAPEEEGLTSLETVLIVISGLFTLIVPFICWFIWRDEHPKKAMQAARIGVVIALIGIVCYCCAFASMCTFMGTGSMMTY